MHNHSSAEGLPALQSSLKAIAPPGTPASLEEVGGQGDVCLHRRGLGALGELAEAAQSRVERTQVQHCQGRLTPREVLLLPELHLHLCNCNSLTHGRSCMV